MASNTTSKAPKFCSKVLDVMRRRILDIPTKRLNISKQIPNNLHEDKSKKRAAILVTFCNQNDRPSVLLTVRSSSVSTHKGDVSFVGGHVEPGESDVQAAIREAVEELGSSLGDVDVIGQCQTVPAITGTLVTPVIGFISKDVGDLKHIQQNRSIGEVDEVFTRSIDLLISSSYVSFEKLERLGKLYTMPVFGKDDGRERIWGLTAMVLQGVLKNLIVPSLDEVNHKSSHEKPEATGADNG